MKKWLLAFLLLATLLFLLLFPVPALAASRRGLNLWFGTLVPTLLPFLILSGFLTTPVWYIFGFSSARFSGGFWQSRLWEAMPASSVSSAAFPWGPRCWRISRETADGP